MSSPTPPNYFQVPEFSQDSKDFISTLPKAKTFITQPLYQYQGFWYVDRCLQGVISCQKNFHVEDSDVFLATYPKCGTTWLKAIMFALLNRKRHPMINDHHHPLLTSNPHDLVPFLEVDLYGRNKVVDIASFPSPRLLSTHMPYVSLPDSIKNNDSSKFKLVYLCRNPKDAFVSIWHFFAKLGIVDATGSIEEAFEYFCRGLSVYGPFQDHVLEYWKQSLENPERVLFVKYEDMKAQPDFHLRRLAEFLGCPFSADEEKSGMVDLILNLCSFDNLSRLKVNKTGKLELGLENNAFFRRGEVGDWENHLSAEMAQKIDQITRDKFSASGLFL